MPSYHSSAITEDYLQRFVLANQRVLKIERSQLQFIDVPKKLRNKNCFELLNILEEFLKKKNINQTGIEHGKLPDPEWIIRILKHLDPLDTCNVFS